MSKSRLEQYIQKVAAPLGYANTVAHVALDGGCRLSVMLRGPNLKAKADRLQAFANIQLPDPDNNDPDGGAPVAMAA